MQNSLRRTSIASGMLAGAAMVAVGGGVAPAGAQPAHATSASSTSTHSAGKAALRYAKHQLGKPYKFGAAGPGTFDCSGLTMKAWKSAAGAKLPHSTQQQFHKGTRVSTKNLKPGDLVFFYPKRGVSHNGVYAGHGKVIHAPRPGKTVEYAPISSMPVAGATRPA